jgi:hypothetical protein
MPNYTDRTTPWNWETSQTVILLLVYLKTKPLIIIFLFLGLKDLTGEAVEVMLLDDKSFADRIPTLWKTMVHNNTGAELCLFLVWESLTFCSQRVLLWDVLMKIQKPVLNTNFPADFFLITHILLLFFTDFIIAFFHKIYILNHRLSRS